jgi:two-component system sensor histidine kinase PilS (NtrC family)
MCLNAATISNSTKDARNTAQSLLENLDAAIILFDSQGRILSANPNACKLPHATAENLSTRKFPELCVSGLRPISEQHGQSAYLERTDAPPIPVAFRRTDVEPPATAIPRLEEKEEPAEATLLVLSDLSSSLELERQLGQVKRITEATRIAGEMAHEIRTPLTTISASIQLLQQYEKNSTAKVWLPK